MKALNDEAEGLYVIRTVSGSEYRFDMTERTVIRHNPLQPKPSDSAPRNVALIRPELRVGYRGMWFDEEWTPHSMTEVVSIERI